MGRLDLDRDKIFEIANSIDEIEMILSGVSFDRFIKESAITDEVTYWLREIGKAASILSIEFKDVYGDVDWDVLNSLQFAPMDQEIEIDPHALWYIVNNDLPKIKDQIYDITVSLDDKDENFYY